MQQEKSKDYCASTNLFDDSCFKCNDVNIGKPKISIPEYHDGPIEYWLKSFELVTSSLDEKSRIALLPMYAGKYSTFLHSVIQESNQCWDDITDILLKRSKTKGSKITVTDALRKFKLSKSESICDFADRVKKASMNYESQLTDSELLDIISGSLGKEFFLLRSNTNNLHQFCMLADTFKASFPIATTDVSNDSINAMTNQPHGQKRSIRCFNCRSEGHIAKNCNKEIIKCSKCKYYGHTEEKCRRYSK